MTVVPDYQPDLDLVALDATGKGTAMAAFWYDEHKRWGILEPMATHTDYQRRGLGRALVAEGLARLENRGARGLWVGNDLPFYLALGFQVKNRIPVWQRA